ncbi:alpha/beta fold hydrolase [Streptomyces sp. NPDC049577]|uniref:esterase/lipase family protein n=1 Tax=Streptomyces sp. NPDC049577 TaxID=3155153 RepID=UPI00341E4A09
MGVSSICRTLARSRALGRPSAALARSTVLELVILAVHVLLYPTGLTQERRPPPLRLTARADLPVHPGDTEGTPGGGIEPGGTPAPGHDERPPVLLLHGFIDNRSVFVLLRRSLCRHGWQHVETLNYSPFTRDLRTAATLLGRHIEEICARTGQSRIDIVGHSLGGLVARYYVQRLGGDTRVRTLVTLGTPHGGTLVAPLLTAHPLVRQMRPDSDVIAELAAPAPHCSTHFISFWSDLDQIMVPVETARIDHADLHARSVRVSGVGHLALPVHAAVAAGIRQALTMEETPAGASGAVSVA